MTCLKSSSIFIVYKWKTAAQTFCICPFVLHRKKNIIHSDILQSFSLCSTIEEKPYRFGMPSRFTHTHQEGSEAHATQTPQPNVKQTHSISLFKKTFTTFKALRRKRSGTLQNTGNKQLVYTFS